MYKSKKSWLFVLLLAVLVRVWAYFPGAVEHLYSNGLYPVISWIQRLLLGWIPFSIGDCFYTAAALFLLAGIGRGIGKLIRREAGGRFWAMEAQKIVFWTMWIYVVFNLFWGLNYNRHGIARQAGLDIEPYTTEELTTVVKVLVKRLDETGPASLRERDKYARKQKLFGDAYASYGVARQQFPFLQYRLKSVKPSIFSYLGDYLGFTGYYNPFTGEAQVNTTVPVFVQPFTTCHELGHQLGYAKENEANFAGYLSSKSSPDTAFRYSVYFDMYLYGIRELVRRDSNAVKEIRKTVPPMVANDYATLRAFYDSYRTPIEPYITGLYAQYLRANQQPSGMQTYNEVMAFLIAYYKKYGEL